MRRVTAISCLLVWSLFASAAARAETSAERAATDPTPTPTAADVISQLYQFDLFQQNAVDQADTAATSDILTTAAARAEAATKRDKTLSELQQQTGINVPSGQKAGAMRAHGLAAADRTDGPSYVRTFYAAQLAEYELAVDVLERYLRQPDNEDVRRFAAAQLSELRPELTATRNALADK
jgi:hypothetical protein